MIPASTPGGLRGLKALLRAAADFAPAEPLPTGLAERALARWDARRAARRRRPLLMSAGLTCAALAVGLALSPPWDSPTPGSEGIPLPMAYLSDIPAPLQGAGNHLFVDPGALPLANLRRPFRTGTGEAVPHTPGRVTGPLSPRAGGTTEISRGQGPWMSGGRPSRPGGAVEAPGFAISSETHTLPGVGPPRTRRDFDNSRRRRPLRIARGTPPRPFRRQPSPRHLKHWQFETVRYQAAGAVAAGWLVETDPEGTLVLTPGVLDAGILTEEIVSPAPGAGSAHGVVE